MNATDRKIFGVLFFSIFAAVTGVGIVVPLLPVYAHDLGARGLYIGLIFGAFSLSRSIFLPYFGRLSDKNGRKPFIVTGLFSYAVISVLFILSSGVESLIVVRFVQGITSAMIMPWLGLQYRSSATKVASPVISPRSMSKGACNSLPLRWNRRCPAGSNRTCEGSRKRRRGSDPAMSPR